MPRTVEETFARSVALVRHQLTVHLPHCSAYIIKKIINGGQPMSAYSQMIRRSERLSPARPVARHSFIKQYHQQESEGSTSGQPQVGKSCQSAVLAE